MHMVYHFELLKTGRPRGAKTVLERRRIDSSNSKRVVEARRQRFVDGSKATNHQQ